MANKTGSALAPKESIGGLISMDPFFRNFEQRMRRFFGEGFGRFFEPHAESTRGWVLVLALLISQTLIFSVEGMAIEPIQNRTKISSAYERGYVAGYSDGYRAGKNDYANLLSRNFRQHLLYSDANRGYQSRYGLFVDYQNGYRLGFEVAYFDGYSGRAFNSRIPSNVTQIARGSELPQDQSDRSRAVNRPIIPEGMSLRIRLETDLATKTNREGDRFTARVVEPSAYEGAMIQGHIAKVEHSGQIIGRTVMALDFDTILLRNGSYGSFQAQIEKVYATESVKSVDEEGKVESASKTTETEIRTIGGAVLGAIIGGIATGGAGAAVGAILGAGVGAGSVYVQGNKDLILNTGTQMLVRVTALQRE